MFGQKIKKCDQFGRDVNFFYKGEEYYRTNWGTAVTFFVAIGYLLMVALKFTEFFGETDPIEYFSETQQDMQEMIGLGEINFSFAVEAIDKEFGNLEVHQIHWSGIDGLKTFTEIEMEPCTTIFGMDLPSNNVYSQVRRREQDSNKDQNATNAFICPSSIAEPMVTQGSYYDEHFSYIQVRIVGCKEEGEASFKCADKYAVKNQKSLRIYMPESSISYQGTETEHALKWTLIDYPVLQIDQNMARKQNIYISKSNVYFENKWSLVELNSLGDSFAEITPGQSWIEPFDVENPIFSTVYFRSNSKMRVYSLEPYKVLDLMGDMGGLLEIGLACGLLLTFFYVKEAFERSIMGDTYQVQKYSDNTSELYYSNRIRNCILGKDIGTGIYKHQ